MKRFSLFALVASVFAACSTDTTQELAPEIPTVPTQLYASFDGQDARVELQGRTMVWTAGDLVSVFYLSNGNDKWAFQGSTGDESGSLMKVAAGEATSATSRVVAVYPYSDTYSIDPATLVVRASLSAEQSYLKDSFGVGSSILVSSGETDHLVFKNVCGWLKLQFAGADAKRVEKITLRGNDGEQVAGDIYINSSDGSCVTASASDAASADDVILTSVTLDCGSGVELNGESPTSFYIALPPQTFAKGLTATAVCADGTQMTKTTPKQVVVKRGHIVPMEEVKYAATNVIYYTSTDGTVVEPRYARFGANVLSNTYENGVGKIVCDGNVTEIGNDAFYQCYKLTSITIPETVKTIGESAFQRCDGIVNITIPNSVTSIGESAFQRCTALTKVVLSNRLTEIKYNTFCDCTALQTVSIPSSVETIGERAFDSCSSLKNLEICNGVKSIEPFAFFECSALTDVLIPNSVTEIGEAAFGSCTKLSEITLGNGLETIGGRAFQMCYALTSVTIPDSVKTIGEQPFQQCFKLGTFNGKYATADKRCLVIDGVLNSYAPAGQTEYTIPEGVTTIGAYSFERTYGLVKITIPKGVTLIDDNAFAFCTNLKSVIIGPSVKKISGFAFDQCKALLEITIPDSVTSIGRYAFDLCSALTSVAIGNNVTSIGNNAFDSCSALTSVTIPDSVTEIGYAAFKNCSALKDVYCKPTTPPTCGSSVFDRNATDRKIYVPASVDNSVIDAYKNTSGWSAYADSIVEKEFGDSNKKTVLRYTSTDGNVVTPNKADAFNVGIISNTYDNDEGTIVFDGTLTTIGASAFYDCTTLSSITIPDSVTEIGAYAFQWCNWLKTVAMGSGVKSIGRGAFWNCTFLQNIELPAGIELIDMQAFYLCKLLKSINIPDSITEIKASTFENCYALKSVNIGQNVEIIGQNAFNHCDALTSVVIPNKVTVIGLYAFSSCTSLQTVTIGTSVTRIDDYAFDTCYSLTSVAISDSVQEIGSYAFYDCASLVSVTIPKNVTKIENHAFDKCYALTSVYCEPTTPPTCGSEVFNNNASGRKIYVPSASVNDYKVSVGWSTYADAVEPH